MKIAIIGAGDIGGTLARHFAGAGQDVMLAARDVAKLATLAGEIGAETGTSVQAARFGEVVVTAISFEAWPKLASDIGAEVVGKVVIDASNPYPDRDGEMARQAVAGGKGSGLVVAAWLPGVRVAKAFNSLFWRDLAEKGRTGLGMAITADDPHARDVTAALVRDAGFEPVVAGGLAETSRFDPGAPAYAKALAPADLKAALAQA